MRKFGSREFALCLLFGGFTTATAAAAENPFKHILEGVKSRLAGSNTIVGTVEVISPFDGIVTCSKDTPGAAISRRPIHSITEAEAFPALIVTKAGVMSSGACAELQKNGLLVLTSGGASAATSAGKAADFKAFADTEIKGICELNLQPVSGKWAE